MVYSSFVNYRGVNMTVAELIQELNRLCEGRDPATVEVKKVSSTDSMWGDDWDHFNLDYAGGNEYPFVVLIK